MKTIGIIGLGAIGYPIAKQLLDNSYGLVTAVHSKRSEEKAVSLGLKIVDSPSAISEYTDTVIILVNDFSQCMECLTSECGLFNSLRSGNIILSSTIDPRQVDELLSVTPNGINIIDAPISGGVTAAEKGSLITMVAGGNDAFQGCQEIMMAYSRKIIYVGERVGSAQALKAVNQMLVGIHMVATAEAMSLAEGLDIPPEKLLETISECSGESNIFKNRMPKLINKDYTARASLATLIKDTGICIDLANLCDSPCHLTKLCHDLFSKTPSFDASMEDACSVIRLYEKEKE